MHGVISIASMDLNGDVESGPISKMERSLFIFNNLIYQKKNLKKIVILWVVFVAFAFDAHANIYNIATSAVSNGTQTLVDIQALVQNATDLFETSPMQHYQRVLDHPESYQHIVSTNYEFGTQVRQSVPLSKLTTTLQAIIEEREFACLAAIHVGVTKRVMVIGNTVYVNPTIANTGLRDQINSIEESAFYPGVTLTTTRYSEIMVHYQTFNGMWTSEIMQKMDSVCAQHCVEAMGTQVNI